MRRRQYDSVVVLGVIVLASVICAASQRRQEDVTLELLRHTLDAGAYAEAREPGD